MMDRFLIAPINTGWETDIKPFLIPDDAFAKLENMYVFRGRLRKRFGGRLMGTGWSSAAVAPLFSRLRLQVGTTDAFGALAGVAPGNIYKIGQLFSIGDNIFTANVAGNPANLLHTGAATTATFSTTTGAFAFTGVVAMTPVYFYTSEPVMGLTNYQIGGINNQPSYAFDTQFAYVFTGSAWQLSSNFSRMAWR